MSASAPTLRPSSLEELPRLPERYFSEEKLSRKCPLKDTLQVFCKKRGQVIYVEWDRYCNPNVKFSFKKGDAVYPVCAAARCRSQVIHAMVKKYFPDDILLFPPHAARSGYDPYNRKIMIHEFEPDTNEDEKHFKAVFGHGKEEPFGHADCKKMEKNDIKGIKAYYDKNYFGPESHHNGKQGNRRIFIVFRSNVHLVMHRLSKTNKDLSNVIIYAIPLIDEITVPPKSAEFESQSFLAYQTFANKLFSLFSFNGMMEPQVGNQKEKNKEKEEDIGDWVLERLLP